MRRSEIALGLARFPKLPISGASRSLSARGLKHALYVGIVAVYIYSRTQSALDLLLCIYFDVAAMLVGLALEVGRQLVVFGLPLLLALVIFRCAHAAP